MDVDGPLNLYAARAHRRPEGYVTYRLMTPGWGAAQRCRLRAWGLPKKRVKPLRCGTVTAGGQSLTWPNVASGAMDNAVASGQTFTVTGTGSTLGFLATSTFGAASGTGTIAYTDGTTQAYTLSAGDWYSTPPTGSTVAITTGYRNTPTGPGGSHPTYVY